MAQRKRQREREGAPEAAAVPPVEEPVNEDADLGGDGNNEEPVTEDDGS